MLVCIPGVALAGCQQAGGSACLILPRNSRESPRGSLEHSAELLGRRRAGRTGQPSGAGWRPDMDVLHSWTGLSGGACRALMLIMHQAHPQRPWWSGLQHLSAKHLSETLSLCPINPESPDRCMRAKARAARRSWRATRARASRSTSRRAWTTCGAPTRSCTPTWRRAGSARGRPRSRSASARTCGASLSPRTPAPPHVACMPESLLCPPLHFGNAAEAWMPLYSLTSLEHSRLCSTWQIHCLPVANRCAIRIAGAAGPCVVKGVSRQQVRPVAGSWWGMQKNDI